MAVSMSLNCQATREVQVMSRQVVSVIQETRNELRELRHYNGQSEIRLLLFYL